jgi:hypothetical protein
MPELSPVPHDEHKEFFASLDLRKGVNVVKMPTIEGSTKTVPFKNDFAFGDTETRVPTDEEAQAKIANFFTELNAYLTSRSARHITTVSQNIVDAQTGQFNVVNYLILEKI